MSGAGFGQPEQTIDARADAAQKPACMALVPVVPSLQWAPIPRLSRPDPSFVTHLIATAEHAPQTRILRRATPADAQTAYRSAANQNQIRITGVQTRHVA